MYLYTKRRLACLSTPIYVYSYVRCVYALVYGRKRERGTGAFSTHDEERTES